MKGKRRLWKIAVPIALVFGMLICLGEFGYTDPDGGVWRYKKTLKPLEGDLDDIYIVYTNKKDLTYEEVKDYYGGLVISSIPEVNTLFYRDIEAEEARDESILKMLKELISEATKFFSGDVDISAEKYDILREVFKEELIKTLGEEEISSLFSGESIFNNSFSYAEDCLDIYSTDTVKTEDFVYGETADKIEYRCSLKEGSAAVFLRNYQESIWARAIEEVDISYEEVIMDSDTDEKMWRIGFYAESYSDENQYVYMDWNGITKKVVSTHRWQED